MRCARSRLRIKNQFAEVITQLAVGEALVSFLDDSGTPGMVERALICPPRSQIGPITPDQRKQLMESSVVAGVYEKAVDRESAYEILKSRAGQPLPNPAGGTAGGAGESGGTPAAAAPPWYENIPGLSGTTGGGRRSDNVVDIMAKSAARAMGSSVGRQIIRGVLGSILGNSKR
jgi:hypothetical protein